MTFPGDRRIFTARGPLDVRVWSTASGVVAELLDGSLSAVGATEDEAVARLALAVDDGGHAET